MKLIRPSFKILSKVDGREILRNIELAGRTCYKSEDKITEYSSMDFAKMIIERGHESVLEHEKISVKIICDRGVSHEIVRHRLASYSQESTRYCNYSKDRFCNEITYIIPPWVGDIQEGESITDERAVLSWINCLKKSEQTYNLLINQGWTPQKARSVLPNSLKTEIVMTCNLREWRHFFKLRTSKAAHPQMREIACPMLDAFRILIPIIFTDIRYEE